jgi:hypothetical protein
VEHWVPPALNPNPGTQIREGTFFSQERFIQAVVRAADSPNVRVSKIQSAKSQAYVSAFEQLRKWKRRSIWLAPFGLYAYPTHADRSLDCISLLVAQLKTVRTVDFWWNVRFDHQDLAKKLTGCGLKRIDGTTQVLYLDRPYDALFRGFTASTRNQIRQAERKGVVISPASDDFDVARYFALYKKLNDAHGRTGYREELFNELFKLKNDVVLLIATLGEEMIGGGWYFRDGNSLMYWDSAIDYQYKHYFPTYAMVNYAIHLACKESMASLNMGSSLGKLSLEQFKSFWGARKVPSWGFVWKNPIWSSASRILRRRP